jgi:UDPglucose 6-dehydrogenase
MQSNFNVVVIGCGKLGAPLVAVLAGAGHKVVGIDKNLELIRNLKESVITWNEPGLGELLFKSLKNITFSPTFEGHFIDVDVSFVIVPTPSNEDGTFTNEYVISAVREIGKQLRESKVASHTVVIVSTVMPGSTSGEIKTELIRAAGNSKVNISICYSPEFIALGSVIEDMKHPDMILIGEEDKKSGDILEEISKSYIEGRPKIHRLTTTEAEIAKISINSYVTTKISFSNQISEICEKTPGASAEVVLSAIGSDRRIGSSYLKAATAFGGPCFPRDNKAFGKYAEKIFASSAIAEATDSINSRQTERLLNLVSKNLGSLRKITLVGVAYKPDTDVIEESPAVAFALMARSNEYLIQIIDDFVSEVPVLPDLQIQKFKDSYQYLASSDAVMLFVPSHRYETAPDFINEETLIFDLWGNWSRYKEIRPSKYFRLGDYRA